MKNDNARIPSVDECVTPCGSPVKTVYEPYFNGVGTVLRSVGRLNTQDEIEAWSKFTDIEYMLHRLKLGDRSVLSSNQPMYGDFASLPTNPLDAINLVHSAEDSFRRLSAEDKQNYNNDWRVWLASMFTSVNQSSVNTDSSVPSSGNTEPSVTE